MKKITGRDIADFLGKPLKGESLAIEKPCNLDDCGTGSLVWVKKFTPERMAVLQKCRPALVIGDAATSAAAPVPSIASDNPRLDFIRVLQRFYAGRREHSIHPTAIIEAGASIGGSVSIGAYTRIGGKVSVGDECIIGSGVSIEGAVSIGKRCVCKANAVIGGQGFGFEHDEGGNPVHFPHIGSIVIEDEVWIGACSTVEIGTLGATTICRGCKIDDLVQVGHNVTVGPDTLVMANTILCGGSLIGRRCWIAPNSVIKEKVRVGNNVTVGLGSVVLKDVDDDLVVAGVPARMLKKKDS